MLVSDAFNPDQIYSFPQVWAMVNHLGIIAIDNNNLRYQLKTHGNSFKIGARWHITGEDIIAFFLGLKTKNTIKPKKSKPRARRKLQDKRTGVKEL